MKIDPNKLQVNKHTIKNLFEYIKTEGKYDDWRDMFESIHNWGYNTDFTYSEVPNHNNLNVYLVAYIKDVFGDVE